MASRRAVRPACVALPLLLLLLLSCAPSSVRGQFDTEDPSLVVDLHVTSFPPGIELPSVTGVAVHNDTVYATLQFDNRIVAIDVHSWQVTHFSGDASGDDEAADAVGRPRQTRFFAPATLAVDAARNTLYVADSGNNAIKAIDLATKESRAFVGGLNSPFGVAVGPRSGTVYVADTNANQVRAVDTAGRTTLIIGNGTIGSHDGKPSETQFNRPTGVAVDELLTNKLYVADQLNGAVRAVDLVTFETTTLSGNVKERVWRDGSTADARWRSPLTITLGPELGKRSTSVLGQLLYVVDNDNHCVRTIDLRHHTVRTVTGRPDQRGDVDGNNLGAEFSFPTQLAFDPSRPLQAYVADQENNKLRRVENQLSPSQRPCADSECGQRRYSVCFGWETLAELECARNEQTKLCEWRSLPCPAWDPDLHCASIFDWCPIKYCAHGFKLDSRGCETCECNSRAQGCTIEIDRCDAAPELVGEFDDSLRTPELSSALATNQTACHARAQHYFELCDNPITHPVYATFLESRLATAFPRDGCAITLPSKCRADRQRPVATPFHDEFAETSLNALVDPNACAARAATWHEFCDFDSNEFVTATFVWTRTTTRYPSSGCLAHLTGCPARERQAHTSIRDRKGEESDKHDSDVDEAACLARAEYYHTRYCNASPDDLVTMEFIASGARSRYPTDGCLITATECPDSPKWLGTHRDDSAERNRDAHLREEVCLGQAQRRWQKTCGAPTAGTVTAMFLATGSTERYPGEGCVITLSRRCTQRKDVRGMQFLDTLGDTLDPRPADVESACFARARFYHDYCQFDPRQPVVVRFVSTGEKYTWPRTSG